MSWPEFLKDEMVYKCGATTAALVKHMLENSDCRIVERTFFDMDADCIGVWDSHSKYNVFDEMFQSWIKINFTPGIPFIGGKDQLWYLYSNMRKKFGKKEFNFHPNVYLVPEESKKVKKIFKKRGDKARFMMKPPNMSRGRGIEAINSFKLIPKEYPMIVQEYITNPHLINGKKYDVRFHILVTSIYPLRVYLFTNGLSRFSNKNFTLDEKYLKDDRVHITTVMTEESEAYLRDQDVDSRKGQKWDFDSLLEYYKENDINFEPVWGEIQDMLTKVMIGNENRTYSYNVGNNTNPYSLYELMGLDIMMDENMKPWLIEFNNNPSMRTKSQIELHFRNVVLMDMFNIVGHHFPCPGQKKEVIDKEMNDFLKQNGASSQKDFESLCLDKRLYSRKLSPTEKAKHDKYEAMGYEKRDEYLETILEDLTPDDVRIILRHEDEWELAKENTVRLYPNGNPKYLKYFEKARYYNMLLDAWTNKCQSEKHHEECLDRIRKLTEQKYHLNVFDDGSPGEW